MSNLSQFFCNNISNYSAGGFVSIFTSTGSLTIPSSATNIFATGFGGGGGGAAGSIGPYNSNISCCAVPGGPGGGGGGFFLYDCANICNSSFQICATIGAGGCPGCACPPSCQTSCLTYCCGAPGGTGGTTSLTNLNGTVCATGGAGGCNAPTNASLSGCAGIGGIGYSPTFVSCGGNGGVGCISAFFCNGNLPGGGGGAGGLMGNGGAGGNGYVTGFMNCPYGIGSSWSTGSGGGFGSGGGAGGTFTCSPSGVQGQNGGGRSLDLECDFCSYVTSTASSVCCSNWISSKNFGQSGLNAKSYGGYVNALSNFGIMESKSSITCSNYFDVFSACFTNFGKYSTAKSLMSAAGPGGAVDSTILAVMSGVFNAGLFLNCNSNGYPGGGGAAGYALACCSGTCSFLGSQTTACRAVNCCYGLNGEIGGNGGFGSGGGGGYGPWANTATCFGGGKGGCGGGGGGGFSSAISTFCNSSGSCGGNGVAMVEYWIS
jgi:hypothetical protein